MTYAFTKISGLPENQILGSGTILDSARLRCGLSEHFQIAQSNIHAYVFGEHGDTSFIPWSGAYISGVSVDEYYDLEKKLGKDIEPIDKEAMLQYVQKSGGEIISKKGVHAVSSSVCKLCKPSGSFLRIHFHSIYYDARRVWHRRCMFKYLNLSRTKRCTGQSSNENDKN